MDQDICTKNQQLISEGFFRVKKNYKILNLVFGDIDLARQILKQKKQNKSHANKQEEKQATEETMMKLIELNNFSEQHQTLISEGFTKTDKNLYLLLRNKGNLQKVLKKLKKNATPILISDNQKSEYEQKQSQLAQMGFTNDKLNLKFLKKKEGNIQAVIEILDKIKEQEMKYPQLKEIRFLKDKLDEKLNLIESQGFNQRSSSFKLLALCNGDVVKTIEILKLKIQLLEEHKKSKQQKMNQKDD